ncbi:MAG: hypothetical protein ACMVO5_09125 [Polymorphobacter sp.]|uniref:hypothetical protein n=1 Tax=Polymorphobacter sp. TaxID=1909290 RepID=UPI003A85F98F
MTKPSKIGLHRFQTFTALGIPGVSLNSQPIGIRYLFISAIFYLPVMFSISGCSDNQDVDKPLLIDFYFFCEGQRESEDPNTKKSLISEQNFVLGFRREFSSFGSYDTKYVYIDGKIDRITDAISRYSSVNDLEYKIYYKENYASGGGMRILSYNFLSKRGSIISYDNNSISNSYIDKFQCTDVTDEKYLKMIINKM